METIANYVIKNNKKMGHWSALLEEWILSIERFSRIAKGDVPYWYNERANVGVLAAAAWRCGRIALEEFQHEKAIDVSSDKESDRTTGKSKNGRCDLWICDDRSEEIIEAKFKWLNMCSEKMDDFAKSCLDAAVDDAIKTYKARNDNTTKAVGVSFLPVYAKADKIGDIEALDEIITKTIKSACKAPADLVAWSFPNRLRKYISESSNYLPGVILLAKTV
ncbi:hypothetical protein KI809_09380 [Geobacter pelophilus]|uniref:Anti-bacteriophage protein A/HamA C-terminal domain-containing protein n=1 Tax=Geoanaerobacter pelophilus TaxID=60036 RepID=A0AAW4L7E9_9BACT|nr:hypothetical protein [Geoanaerobacter pelophilus]MBT0664510.1 hypothetical protein [Geoanaerobacter pelophilus]